ncbi:hypothetical protein M885DRAFT_515080 [Pelagophyceae sp. CCMP2097]|nr:hypothetical protein M885DRAFT_515080 [Pelagophyceae sp. CCMP2097]
MRRGFCVATRFSFFVKCRGFDCAAQRLCGAVPRPAAHFRCPRPRGTRRRLREAAQSAPRRHAALDQVRKMRRLRPPRVPSRAAHHRQPDRDRWRRHRRPRFGAVPAAARHGGQSLRARVSFEERRPGYGLTLQQGGRALRGLGALESAREASSYTDCRVAFDALEARVLGVHGDSERPQQPPGDEAQGDSVQAEAEAKNYAIHLPRDALRALLLARLDAGTVRWGHAPRAARDVAPAEEGGDETFDLDFEATTPPASEWFDGWWPTGDSAAATVRVAASVVVGADGVHSACRAASSADDTTSRSAGVFVCLGYAKLPLLDAGDDASTWPPNGRTFGDIVFEAVDGSAQCPLTRRRARRCGSCRGPSPSMASSTRRTARSAAPRCAGKRWRSSTRGRCPSAARSSKPPGDVAGYPIVDREPDDPSVLRGRLPAGVALGDAARRAPSPHRRLGARPPPLRLGPRRRRCIREPRGRRIRRRFAAAAAAGAWDLSFAAYYDKMLPRAQNKIKASRLAADLLHSEAARTRSFGVTSLRRQGRDRGGAASGPRTCGQGALKTIS